MRVQNLKFVALPVSEIIGGTQKIGQSLDTRTPLEYCSSDKVLIYGQAETLTV